MGGQSSKNVTDIVNSTTASVIMQSMQSCMAQSSQSQSISGSTVNGVTQQATSVINVACASHFNMSSDLSFAIANAIQQQAETKGIALLDTLHLSRAENITHIANSVSANISSQMVQMVIANSAQDQSITNSNVTNSKQILDANTTLSALQKMVANTSLASDIQNKTSQKSSATQANPLSFITDSIYMMIAVLFFIIVIIGGLLYVVFA